MYRSVSRSIRPMTSTSHCRRAVRGWRSVPTGGAGILTALTRRGVPTALGPGCGQMTVGTGKATNRGPGRATTTVAGPTILITAGFGRLTPFEDRHGFAFVKMAATVVGRHCRRARYLVRGASG